MSSRTSRKAAHPRAKAPEPIITRNKSAQQKRQLRIKEAKKTEKPELTKPETKSPKQSNKEPEIRFTKIDIKPPKITKTVKRSQVSLLKPIEVSDDVLEQIEYYPNTLKREFRAKKIMLKPKHNFKVVAATNKRKLATPQKGTESPSSDPLSPQPSRTSTRPCSPELSMQDMVRMMDETRSLSDEDFMEILTCPSPVWWEDPPDGGFDEGSIHTRMPAPPPKKMPSNKKRKISTNKTTKSKKKHIVIDLVDDIEPPKRKAENTDERFVKKKQKLESILGNIKNKYQPKINNTGRKISESEGDFSDLSFNEEEILKNLENMDIPVAETSKESTNETKNETDELKIKKELIDTHENDINASKNDEADREVPSTDSKPVIKEVFSINSSVFDSNECKNEDCSEENLDSKSDDVVISDSANSTQGNEDSSSVIDLNENSSNSEMGKKSPNVEETKKSETVRNDVPNKKTKVLSEYINVYKITPDKIKDENSDNDSKPAENNAISKLEAVLKLNDFFRHCKSNKRLKKYKKPIPANPVTDVKEATIENKKENSDGTIDLDDEKNRLKSLEFQKTENGTKECFHEKCDISPVFPCGLCNFKTDTKEVLMQHVSSCKDVARIKWSHNYVLNQT